MTGNEKLVSVVIPYYNGKEFIEETIISVINQTYKNIEIIVVDDCSPREGDSEFLQELSSKYEFKIANQKCNLGTSSAIAFGIENSSGEYVALLAHDDLFVEDKIQMQMDYLKENSSKVCVFGDMEEFSESTDNVKIISCGEKYLKEFSGLDKNTLMKKFFVEGIFPNLYIQTLLVEKEFALKELVPIWHRSKADSLPVTIHLFLHHIDKVGVINKPLTRYRQHDENISKNKYKMFDLQMDTVMNYCPKEYQKQAIGRIIHLLDDCKTPKKHKNKRFAKLLNSIKKRVPKLSNPS